MDIACGVGWTRRLTDNCPNIALAHGVYDISASALAYAQSIIATSELNIFAKMHSASEG